MSLAGHRATIRQWAALPLRLIVGYGFIAHGYAKVMNGPDRFAASLHALGVPASHSMAWVTIICELLGGSGPLALDQLRARTAVTYQTMTRRPDDHARRSPL
jgi:uncharacterized membrane protein YphA (DoxX/SURF4 family)